MLNSVTATMKFYDMKTTDIGPIVQYNYIKCSGLISGQPIALYTHCFILYAPYSINTELIIVTMDSIIPNHGTVGNSVSFVR